ncbi:hypothetical protein GCM10009798_42490 [Nocardioides panacihumi]|uniref:Uncharacterized protein n=1 Tax=Nocardioides panacihumi TaxID=400774 RepID=A0ABP5DAF0_9ACTN
MSQATATPPTQALLQGALSAAEVVAVHTQRAVGADPREGAAARATTMTTTSAKAATHLQQWMFDPNVQHHTLLPKSSFAGPENRNVNLKNSETHHFLQWEKQLFGINLGWTDDASPKTAQRVERWFFTKPGNDESPLRYGDVFAMGYGISPSYVFYTERSVGINLAWSGKPKFEWEILGGNRGAQVQSGDWVAIYNRVVKETLIYFPRELGGQIGWPSSLTLIDQILQRLGDAALDFIKDHWREGLTYLLAL